MSAIRLTDNLKGVPISAMPEEAWTYLAGHGADTDRRVLEYYQSVPWLYRGVNLRMETIKALPYRIRAGDDMVALEEFDLAGRLGFRVNLRALLAQWEGHLTLFGAAYADRQRNRVRATGLRVLHPLTIRPVTNAEQGLTGFRRTVQGSGDRLYEVDDLVYVWLPNMEYEIGPGTPPAKAALHAAGMLKSMQLLGQIRFEKGALKPMLLLVPDGTGEADRERLESWARRLVGGLRNAFSVTAVREGVKLAEVGSDVGDLAMPELTTVQREDIATALGIPQTLLFSNAANYATSENDYRQFYDTTVIPSAQRMCEALTEQLLSNYGLILEEAHEELELYQDDKEAESYKLLAALEAGTVSPDEVRARLDMDDLDEATRTAIYEHLRAVAVAKNPQLGLPSPAAEGIMAPPARDDQARDSAAEEGGEGARESVTAEAGTAGAASSGNTRRVSELADDLDRWERKALRRFEEGKPHRALEFESVAIPDTLAEAIRGALETAQTAADVRAAFMWADYPLVPRHVAVG